MGIAKLHDYDIVIPARNEEHAISETVAGLLRVSRMRSLQLQVIVVDDGSTDRTAERALSAGALVVPQNPRGKGAALQNGILRSTASVVAWCDADAPIAAFAVIESAVKAGREDVLIAGRRIGPRRTSGHSIRRALGTVVRSAWSLVTNSRLTDPFCPLKAAPGDAARAVAANCKATGYAFDAEFILEWERHDWPVEEIDAIWTDLRGQMSALRLFGSARDITRYLVESR